MSKKSKSTVSRFRIQPFWYVIGLFILGALIVFINHLVTGQTPSNVAITIEVFNFDIFWYGIIIIGGIGLGSWVTATLAAEWAREDFNKTVPEKIQKRPLTKLELPADLSKALAKRKIFNLGNLLYEWGLDPNRLGLNDESEELLLEKLEEQPDLEPHWLEAAHWRQWNPDFVWGGVAWALVLGVIGARLYHVLTPTPSQAPAINSALDYFRNPQELINIRSGGLGIFGAFLGGLVGIFLYTWRHRISAIAWADLAVVGLALGQFVGRWGNFFNQELYGSPSQLPWAIYIDRPLPGYEQFSRFHPAFLYESLWNLANFCILYTLAHRYRHKLQRGDLLALYLVLYGVGRILLELIRLDSRTFSIAGIDLGIPVATVVSLVIAIPMAVLLLYRHVFAKGSEYSE